MIWLNSRWCQCMHLANDDEIGIRNKVTGLDDSSREDLMTQCFTEHKMLRVIVKTNKPYF